MSGAWRDLVVVGQGAAGLSAALAAAEEARRRAAPVRVTLIDKAPEAEAGGNTRWSPSYMRMAAPDRVEPGFVRDMLAATGPEGDEAYFARLAADAPATIAWIATHGVTFTQPTYYLAKGPARIQPAGGGPAIIAALTRAASAAGVAMRYGCAARAIVTQAGRVSGLALEGGATIAADAVVLACGGFQGNAAMMRAQFGAGAETMRLISPGTRFNTGDGIEHGAGARRRHAPATGTACMPSRSMRARDNSAPVVLVYPYGIVVDRNGRRFFDEGGGLVHETWEWFARELHFKTPGPIGYAILDSRLHRDRRLAARDPFRRGAAALRYARRAGATDRHRCRALAATVAAYNAACTGDPAAFDATRRDGLAADRTLQPPKSNWARAIAVAPFLA